MTHTRDRDLRRALGALNDIWQLEEPEAPSAALSAMFELVPCEFSVVGWLDTRTGTIAGRSCPSSAVETLLHGDPEVVAGHPLVTAMQKYGPGTRRIGDVLSDRDWRNHPARSAMAEVV